MMLAGPFCRTATRGGPDVARQDQRHATGSSKQVGCRRFVVATLVPLMTFFSIVLPAGRALALDPSTIADVGVNVSAPSFPAVGANFDITVKVTNHGPNPATNVQMNNQFSPQDVTFQAATSSDPTDTCSALSTYPNVSCSLGTLASAETTTITITVLRNSSAEIYDYAYASGDSDPYGDNNSDHVIIQQPVVPPGPDAADLAISVQAPPSPATGSTFDYAITVTNLGPSTATNVVASDFLPSQVTFSSAAPLACSYSTYGSKVGCYFASLASGDSRSITISVTRQSGQAFTNTAYVASDADPVGGNNSANVITQVDPGAVADVGITAEAPTAPVLGSNFSVTLTVTNHGPNPATNVSLYSYVTDYTPSGVTFVSITPTANCGYSVQYDEISCSFASINSGASVSVIWTMTRDVARPLNFYAQVVSDLDLNRNNDTAFLGVGADLTNAADVGVTVRAPAQPATGSTFDYTIDVTNHGPGSATGVTIGDPLPPQVSFVSVNSSLCRTSGTSYVSCYFDPLANGASVQVKITVRRDSGQSFDNTAYVNSDVDLNPDNDSDFATVQTDPGAAADVGVQMSAPSTLPIGSASSYSIVTTNYGPATATNVRVQDVLPPQVSYQSSAPLSACSYLNGTHKVVCNLGTMTSGAASTVTVTVIRNTSEAFSNTAQITSGLDLNAANDVATVATGGLTVLPIAVSDTGFSPPTLSAATESTIGWQFNGPSSQSVTDSSGMNLFDSGPQTTGANYSFTFFGAGTYAYKSTVNPALTGKVTVPPSIAPTSGTTSTVFTVTWASSTPPSGYVFDIQKKNPGATWTNWLTGQTSVGGGFTPAAGAGKYSFRVRLRKTNGTKSGWSPIKSISVT